MNAPEALSILGNPVERLLRDMARARGLVLAPARYDLAMGDGVVTSAQDIVRPDNGDGPFIVTQIDLVNFTLPSAVQFFVDIEASSRRITDGTKVDGLELFTAGPINTARGRFLPAPIFVDRGGQLIMRVTPQSGAVASCRIPLVGFHLREAGSLGRAPDGVADICAREMRMRVGELYAASLEATSTDAAPQKRIQHAVWWDFLALQMAGDVTDLRAHIASRELFPKGIADTGIGGSGRERFMRLGMGTEAGASVGMRQVSSSTTRMLLAGRAYRRG